MNDVLLVYIGLLLLALVVIRVIIAIIEAIAEILGG